MSTAETVITGGMVVDGTGAPAYTADVGISAGRIVAISREPLRGTTTIDATNQIVAPGFVDLHSHADFTLEGSPAAETQLSQGVTTMLTGNCGVSPFPLLDAAKLQSATSFMTPEISWSWTDATGFAQTLRERRPAVNVALQVGHNALRIAVMGDEERPATADELEQMCAMLRISASSGVFGFSTGLIYAPGAYAPADEIRALVTTAARSGLLYSTHMRNESSDLLSAVDEAIGTARSTGARLEISHLKAMGPANHGLVRDALDLIDQARDDGIDVAADVYPYTASSTTLTSRLPAWSLDGGTPALLQRLAHHESRQRIAGELAARFGRDVDPDGVVIADLPQGPYSGAVGTSLAAIGRADGVDPAEAAMRVLEGHQAAVAVVNHAMSEKDVTAVLSHPHVSVASDGWIMRASGPGRPHPRSFGTFARVLGRYVRDTGVLSLEEAVRKMTSLPARRLGLRDRGVLAEGLVADIAVFDRATVIDRSTYEEPWQLAEGFSTVLVNGVVALRDGALSDARPGAVLEASYRR